MAARAELLYDTEAALRLVDHELSEHREAIAEAVAEALADAIAAAAAAEFLSLRTANRRIAEARALFGVRTTREAVLAYLRQRRAE